MPASNTKYSNSEDALKINLKACILFRYLKTAYAAGKTVGSCSYQICYKFYHKRIFSCPVILGPEPTTFPTKHGPLVGNIITRVVAGMVVVGRGQSRNK